MGKKRRLEEIIKSNFARHIVAPFIFLLLIVTIINFVVMEETIRPKVGAAIGSVITSDNINITAQIRTLKDNYGLNEIVNLTDPPLPGWCNSSNDTIICQPGPADVDDSFVAGLYDVGQTCGQTTGADNYRDNNYGDSDLLYAITIGVHDANYVEDQRACGTGGWCTTKDGYNRVLLKFNDLSSLPFQATSVILRVYTTENINDLGLYEIISDWDENNVTWNNQPSQGASYGFLTSAGEGWYEKDITTLYNDWKSNPSSNYGVYLYSNTRDTSPWVCWNNYYTQPGNGPIYSTFLRIYSSDHAIASHRPKLVITSCINGTIQNCSLQQGICAGSFETCTANGWPGCNETTYLNWNSSYEVSEINCTDSLDNDCDNRTDLADSDCGCIAPTDGMIITNDTFFCPGDYDLPNGINIGSDNITLDCNGGVLNGTYVGVTSGINLENRSNNIIRNCEIKNYDVGIYLNYSDNNTMISNNVYLNNDRGIVIYNSKKNNMMENSLYSNNIFGIVLINSSNNDIASNNISDNNDIGIYLDSLSINNSIDSNIICGHSDYDINDSDSNRGDNNTCDNVENWNDLGTTGCTNSCISGVAPNIFQISPEDGYYSQSGNITFICNATDDVGLDNIYFYHDINGSFVLNDTVNVSGLGNSSNWTINDIPDGNYIWACAAEDIGGLIVFSDNRSFNILRKTTPEENQSKIYHNSTSAIIINVTLKVQYNNGTAWVDEAIIVNNQEEVIVSGGVLPLDLLWNPIGWNTSNAAVHGTGVHNYSAVVEVDYNGTINSVRHLFTVNVPDTFPPNIILNYPDDDYITDDDGVGLNWSVADDSYPVICNLTIDGIVNVSDINITNNDAVVYSINFTRGTHNWSVRCIDNASNYNSSETRIFGIACPVGQALCDNGSCSDNCGVVADCIVENGICEIGEGCDCNDCNMQQDLCADGYVCNNITTNCERSIGVELISPPNETITAFDDINLTCRATSYYELINITLYHNITELADQFRTISGNINTTIFNLINLPNGTYEWNCLAYDDSGLSALAANNWSFTIDASRPISQILDPLDGAALDNRSLPYNVSGIANGSVSNISYVDLIIDGVPHRVNGTDNWYYVWNPITEGSHVLISRAVDDNGNIEADIEDVRVYISFTSNITNSTAINSTKDNSTVINSTNVNSTVNNSIENSCTLTNSNLIDSICDNCTLINSDLIENSVCNDSVKIDSTNRNSMIDPSYEENCTLINASLSNSICINCTLINSDLIDSVCENSVKIDSIDINVTLINSSEDNCTIVDSVLINSSCKNSIIDNSIKNNSININSTINNTNEQNCDIINMVVFDRNCIDDCGDGVCSGETCSSCEVDCGTCPTPTSSGGGGGGGGCTNRWECGAWSSCREGIQNRTCIDTNRCRTERNKPNETQACTCMEDWSCTDWTECGPDGKQTRECGDWNDCGTIALRPDIEQDCEYVPPVVVVYATCYDSIRNQGESGIDCGGPCKPCPSCNDGIKNQGESGIDCGGPCSPCPEVPKGIPWWFILLLLLIIIILVGGIGFGTYYYWPQINDKLQTLTASSRIGRPEDLLEVEKYAQRMENEGYNDQQIVNALKKTGWNEEQIHMVMHKVHKPTGNLVNMVEYIKKCRRLGYSDDKTKLMLLKVGWPAVQISKVFEMKAVKRE